MEIKRYISELQCLRFGRDVIYSWWMLKTSASDHIGIVFGSLFHNPGPLSVIPAQFCSPCRKMVIGISFYLYLRNARRVEKVM